MLISQQESKILVCDSWKMSKGSKKESVVSLPIITAGNERIIDICKSSLDEHSNTDTVSVENKLS